MLQTDTEQASSRDARRSISVGRVFRGRHFLHHRSSVQARVAISIAGAEVHSQAFSLQEMVT